MKADAMTKSFTEHVEEARATDQADWLGSLVYFHVSESNVEHKKLAKFLKLADLEKFTPSEPRDDDVFRRVFFDGKRRSGLPTDEEGVTENINIFQVSRKGGDIVKRVVVVTVDSDGAELGFKEKLELDFQLAKSDNGPRIRNLNGRHSQSTALVQRLLADYHEQRGCVNANAMRGVVRDVIESCRPTQLRPGLYFVPAEHADTVSNLEGVGKALPGTTVHSIPLVDDEKQRHNLKEAFQDEVTTECDRLLSELNVVLSSKDELTQAKGGAYTQAIANQRAKLETYRELLADNLDTAEMRIAVLQTKLTAVLRTAK